MRHASLALLAALVPACEWPPEPQYCEAEWGAVPAETTSTSTQRQLVAQVLPTDSSAIDILFVIDDSRSMTDEQEQLGIWSNELFDVLGATGELPDLHIAVTSSSLAISDLQGCSTTGGLHTGDAALSEHVYLTDVATPTGRARNYVGTLTDTFAKMALVGDTGCGFEQPFAAARQVLSGYATGSQGFLRDDALLLVVFVTDEDDCSVTDSQFYSEPYGDACTALGALTSYRCFEQGVTCHDGRGTRALGERDNCRPNDSSPYLESVTRFGDYLRGLKDNPAQVVVAGIYGKPNRVYTVPDERVTGYTQPRLADVCGVSSTMQGDGATPAVRMNALLASFGGRASQSSICETELSWAMHDVGMLTQGAATRSRCLRGALVDTDTTRDGVQPACSVRVGAADAPPLPPCGVVPDGPCFAIEDDTACAETASQLAVRVEGSADTATVLVECDVDTAR